MLIDLSAEELATVKDSLKFHRAALSLSACWDERRGQEALAIDAALAALARPLGQQWMPVEDGPYDGQHVGDSIAVEGDWLVICEQVIGVDEVIEAQLALPDGVRLCRLTQPAAGTGEGAQPVVQMLSDETIETIEDALSIAIVDCMADNKDGLTFYEYARNEFRAWLQRQRPAAQEGEGT